jgi:hypothetical protein
VRVRVRAVRPAPHRQARRPRTSLPLQTLPGGPEPYEGPPHQRKAAKALGIPKVGPMRSGQEEHWGGAVRVEVKSGAQCGPIITRFRNAEAQSEYNAPSAITARS